MNSNPTPPNTEEYAPFYSDYIERAKAKGDVIAALPQQIEDIRSALGKLSDQQARFRISADDWSSDHINYKRYAETIELLRYDRADMLKEVIDAWKAENPSEEVEWLSDGVIK